MSANWLSWLGQAALSQVVLLTWTITLGLVPLGYDLLYVCHSWDSDIFLQFWQKHERVSLAAQTHFMPNIILWTKWGSRDFFLIVAENTTGPRGAYDYRRKRENEEEPVVCHWCMDHAHGCMCHKPGGDSTWLHQVTFSPAGSESFCLLCFLQLLLLF